MCGRYSFILEDEMIRERFGVTVRSAIYKARYNCAPTQKLAVISNENPEELSLYRWGLIPFWAKDAAIGNKLINAKSETILEKPSFKNSFKSKRCLVLSDGFYEWRKGSVTTPFRILRKDGSAFAMAGIWDRWINPEGEEIRSFAILTTTPNSLMAKIHDRMPVILDRETEKLWIENSTPEILMEMLKPCPASTLLAYPVSTLVNSPRADSPEILEPAGDSIS
ncbi:MAG: SOS response-associated peptidase [Bacteroidetes bacterium]|nr:SOS response-associated peptidase [Bacteroidota bacterium]